MGANVRRRWGNGEVRALLRKVHAPGAFDGDASAVALCDRFNTANPAHAVRMLVKQALQPYPSIYTDVILRVDLEAGTKQDFSDDVASDLGLSIRTMYRFRARALSAIARELETASVVAPGEVRQVSLDLPDRSAALIAEGRHAMRRRSLDSLQFALSCFGRALGADATSAPAYAGIAEARFILGVSLLRHPGTEFREAGDAVAQGLRCDPKHAELHAVSAMLQMFEHHDFEQARLLVSRALALNPSSPTVRNTAATLSMLCGKFGEAVRHAQEVLGCEEDLLAVRTTLGLALNRFGNRSEGIRVLREAVTLDPEYSPARFELARVLAGSRKYQESREHLTILLAAEPRRSYAAALALVASLQGDPMPAKEYLRSQRSRSPSWVSHYLRAYAYVGLGLKKEAFLALVDAESAREPWTVLMDMDEFLNDFGASRSVAMLRRTGLSVVGARRNRDAGGQRMPSNVGRVS